LRKLIGHGFIPKHEILKADKVSKLLNRYKIDAKKIPKILSTDVVVKLLDAKAGDVIKIERRSKTAGIAAYYRIVVRG